VLRAASDGDFVAAIERLSRDRYQRFLALAVAMLGDLDRGRDAVHEAFVRALRSRGELRRVESLPAWLWQTVVNVCRDEYRHAVAYLDEGYEPEAHNAAEPNIELRAVIAALPERQRLVLFLRHYADLDYDSIAKVLGIERGTVAATLHKTHAKLREAMTEVPT
jgi:RNA polymerase sigma-70 factor, ECF subfamily